MTASGDCTIRLWAVKDGACLKTMTGHNASVLQASFLSAGTQIVSSGGDGLIKIWSIRSGECVSTFECHEDKVRDSTTLFRPMQIAYRTPSKHYNAVQA